MTQFDVIVVGAGPAGSVCAAFCASRGHRTLLLEKEPFPRDKVCGDCLNPSCWEILDRLGLRERIVAFPHSTARSIQYVGTGGNRIQFPQPASENPQLIIKRRHLDAALAARAVELGADFRDGLAVTEILPRWQVATSGGKFSAPVLIAADGRNSLVARSAGMLGSARRERIAIQQHFPAPPGSREQITLMFHRHGYGGLAEVGGGEANLCLVARPRHLSRLKREAESRFEIPAENPWRTIAPLSRPSARPVAASGVFAIGDAARIVEPFTGEGIYYAMRSAELACDAICTMPPGQAEMSYRRSHRSIYRGRLWINRLAKAAALHPVAASVLLRICCLAPQPLAFLSSCVLSAKAKYGTVNSRRL